MAARIARVLALRSDTTVELGPPPPPGLLEAVPAGNVAIERDEDGVIHLVMGAALGEWYEARVDPSANIRSKREADVRALALAIETLRDQAIESRARQEATLTRPEPARAAEPEIALDPEAQPPFEPALAPPLAAEARLPAGSAPAPGPLRLSRPTMDGVLHDDGSPYPRPERADHTLRVEPLLFLALYGGASVESNALRTGISTGGGLCVKGQCVVLAVEYPLPINMEAGGDDVRYRYPTFSCSFYSRPFHFGRFTPAASVGFLSRIGHFERDMGFVNDQHGLDTDLGLRGTLEGAYELFDSVDLMAMAGLDYALDRWQFGYGDTVAYRGNRLAPWLQAGIRIRPH